jgi:hypothetical protein
MSCIPSQIKVGTRFLQQHLQIPILPSKGQPQLREASLLSRLHRLLSISTAPILTMIAGMRPWSQPISVDHNLLHHLHPEITGRIAESRVAKIPPKKRGGRIKPNRKEGTRRDGKVQRDIIDLIRYSTLPSSEHRLQSLSSFDSS